MNKEDLINAIDEISIACGQTEASKGFREDWYLATKLEGFAKDIRTARSEQDFPSTEEDAEVLDAAAKALRNSYISMKLMLVVSEISEALETLRVTGVDGLSNDGNFGEELSDAHIRLFALEHLLATDPSGNLLDKMNVNTDRPHKHGKVI